MSNRETVLSRNQGLIFVLIKSVFPDHLGIYSSDAEVQITGFLLNLMQ